MSALAETRAFRAFAAHWFAHAAAFGGHYNAARAEYAARHNVAHPQRPVAPLILDERIETPFWVYRAGDARQRLFLEQRGEAIEFFAGEQLIGGVSRASLAAVTNARAEIPAGADDTAAWLFSANGWRLRPRALILSAFSRLFVADVFIHGIGGVNYDEMTESIVRRVFGVELPPLLCVTATVLRFAEHAAALAALDGPAFDRRRLRYNPQLVLADVARELVEEKERLVREAVALQRGPDRLDRPRRRRIFEAIRSLNQRMLTESAAEVARREADLAEHEKSRDAIAAAQDREYFFAFHLRDTLRAVKERMHNALRMTA